MSEGHQKMPPSFSEFRYPIFCRADMPITCLLSSIITSRVPNKIKCLGGRKSYLNKPCHLYVTELDRPPMQTPSKARNGPLFTIHVCSHCSQSFNLIRNHRNMSDTNVTKPNAAIQVSSRRSAPRSCTSTGRPATTA